LDNPIKREVILTNIGFPIQLKTRHFFFFIILFVFSMVSELQARTAEEWYAKGFEQSLDGSKKKAIQSYQQALRLKNNWPQAHHNLSLLFYQIKDGVKAVYHLRLAEKLYLKDSSPESRRNLIIVQKNLQKSYAEFDLNPEEFEELEILHPASQSESWQMKGNGFVFGGYVFTLADSLKDASAVRVRLGGQPPVSAKIVKRYIVYDLALLKLETKQPGFQFSDSSVYKVGDVLESPGFNGSDQSLLIKGSITGLNAIMNDKNMFELKFSSPPAQGSPLLNESGQVAGMVLSTEKIVRNFQAAGVAPEGSIALKASYLSKIFSLYKNSLRGPQKKGSGEKKDPLTLFAADWKSALAVIEGKVGASP
jgi:S1-C subfamily serine protease